MNGEGGGSAMERMLAQPAGEDSPLKELFDVGDSLMMKSEIPPGLILHLARAYVIADITKSKTLKNFCLPGGTKIIVRNVGYSGLQRTSEYTIRNIEDLSIGDEILTYNQISAEKEFRKIVKVYQRETNDLYRMRFSNNNELWLTSEHPVGIVKDDGSLEWICAKDVEVGMHAIQLLYKGLELRCRQLAENCVEKNDNMKQFMHNSDMKLINVTSVEKMDVPPETVYNLEVEGNNNYFAYGILNHNCDTILRLQISKDRKGRIELMESIIARMRRTEDED